MTLLAGSSRTRSSRRGVTGEIGTEMSTRGPVDVVDSVAAAADLAIEVRDVSVILLK